MRVVVSILHICTLLVIIGALNWLAIGCSEHLDNNLVARLNNVKVERSVYILIGVAGLLLLSAKVAKMSGYNVWKSQ